MEKIMLNEAAFSSYLEAQTYNDLIDLKQDLDESSYAMYKSLKILYEATLLELKQGERGTENGDNRADNHERRHLQKTDIEDILNDNNKDSLGKMLDIYDDMYRRVNRKVEEDNGDSGFYKPIQGAVEVTKMSSMKFPQNIIFFITQLIKWIKNNILNFIDKFSNIVRSLLGLETAKSKFNKKDLELSFNKATDIETKYTLTPKDVYKKNEFLNKVTFTPKAKPVELFTIDAEDANILESLDIFGSTNTVLREGEDKINVIRLDTSKDLLALKQSLEHFFDLFDSAYGSNDEKLFSTDDLAIMLDIFKNTIKDLNNPNNAVEVQGRLQFSGDAVDPNRIKDNLLRTKINTDNLKNAYAVTNKQINTIAQIIINKNLLGATNMGVQYVFLSASTYQVIIELYDIVEAKLKEAQKMDAKLQKMKKEYERLVNTLETYRTKLNTISGMTWTTVLQRRINDLYDASRYMTQLVQLRSSTLALYISELNDTRAILKNLSAVPSNALGGNKKKLLKAYNSIWK